MWSMVPVARVTMSSVYTCQGQLLRLETDAKVIRVRSKETENANYDAHTASEKFQCGYPATQLRKVSTIIMNFFKFY